MRGLESLDAYRLAEELSRAAYRLTLVAPLCHHFGLRDQIRSAAVSVPANLVEGYALGTRPQFIRHIRISLGSAVELRRHIQMAKDLGLSSPDPSIEALTLNSRVVSLLIGLVRHLRNTKSG